MLLNSMLGQGTSFGSPRAVLRGGVYIKTKFAQIASKLLKGTSIHVLLDGSSNAMPFMLIRTEIISR